MSDIPTHPRDAASDRWAAMVRDYEARREAELAALHSRQRLRIAVVLIGGGLFFTLGVLALAIFIASLGAAQ